MNFNNILLSNCYDIATIILNYSFKFELKVAAFSLDASS